MTQLSFSLGPPLAQHQQQFVGDVVAHFERGALLALVSPPGTGGTRAVAAACTELFEKKMARRILVLTSNRLLLEQWTGALQVFHGYVQPLDGRTWRALRNRVVHDSDGVPSGVSIMIRQLAVRSEVKSVLLALPWDLIIVDGDDAATDLQLEPVRSRPGGPAVLVVRSSVSTAAESNFVADWSELLPSGQLGQVPPRIVHEFRRSDEEATLAAGVLQMAESCTPLVGVLLERAGASSASYLEHVLLKRQDAPSLADEERNIIDGLLDQIEDLGVDERVNCLVQTLKELLQENNRRVVVFCEFRTTLAYVATALSEVSSSVLRLDAGTAGADKTATVRQFREHGGVLVLTAAGSTGLFLDAVTDVVHYDLPMQHRFMAMRREVYLRPDSPAATEHFFRDERCAWPIEVSQLAAVDAPSDTEAADVGVASDLLIEDD